MKKKDFLSISNLSKKDILLIINLAKKIKENPEIFSKKLERKNGACIFDRPSTRTRYSFHKAVKEMKGDYISLPWEGSFPKLLPLQAADIDVEMKSLAAQGLDFMLIRVNSQNYVEALAKYASFSIVNGCTNEEHPLQALTDYLTITENFEDLNNLNFTFLGNGISPVFKSLTHLFSKLDLKMNLVSPKEYTDSNFCKEFNVNQQEELSSADVIYLDQWEYDKKQAIPHKYKLPKDLNNTKIMHCLPNGTEITANILNSKNSLCYQQAENRIHIQKAVLLLCLGL